MLKKSVLSQSEATTESESVAHTTVPCRAERDSSLLTYSRLIRLDGTGTPSLPCLLRD